MTEQKVPRKEEFFPMILTDEETRTKYFLITHITQPF